jgi:DNA-binding transcriptional MerR regulator
MPQEPVVIPEKLYFKIGDVCELLGVQPHVLRYWETEFPMLSPQKNKSGQRSYRRKDVEMALKIKTLLYNEMFTIAGARKKLINEHRAAKDKAATPAAPLVDETPEAAPPINEAAASEPAPERPVIRTEPPRPAPRPFSDAPTLFEGVYDVPPNASDSANGRKAKPDVQDALKTIAANLLEIRELLKENRF